jgi:hypothetical protein
MSAQKEEVGQAETIEALILRRIFVALVTGIFAVVIGAAGIGAFFARLDEQVASLRASVARLETSMTTITTGVDQRLNVVEVAIARGLLPEAERRLRNLEEAQRRILIKIGNGSRYDD